MKPTDGRLVLRLLVVPNARRTEVMEEHGEAVKIRVQAPAQDGKANEALRTFLAKRLQVASRCVELVAGAKSRDKAIAITGLSLEEVRARLGTT